MPRSELYPVKKVIGFDRAMLDAVETWRAVRQPIPSASEAIRRLVAIGLEAKQLPRPKTTAERSAGAAYAKRAAEFEIDRRHRSSGQTAKAKAWQRRALTDKPKR